MAAAPMVMMGVSTAVGMAGAMSQGAGEQAAANYSASIKQQQATAAIQDAAENARRQQVQARLALGGIRAGVGASGIQTEGSALDVLQNSASNAKLDTLTILHQGEMKAWAARAGASLDMLKGQNARDQGNFSAAGYLLKGIGGGMSSMGGGGGGGGGGEDMMAGEGDAGAAAAIA